MLDASLVIIEVISQHQRAPSVRAQKALIREDGTEPERAFEAPGELELIPLLLDKNEGDIIAIAHPKAFGPPKVTRVLLDGLARHKAMVKLPNEEPIDLQPQKARDDFLLRAASTPWGRGTRKQQRNPGRPHKRKQPSEEVMTMFRSMWFDPDNYPPRRLLPLATAQLGRIVDLWEFKHWFGPKRKVDDGSSEE